MKLKMISRGLATVFIALFAVMLGLTALAIESEADLNQMFGTTSIEVRYAEDGSQENTEYYSKTTRSIDAFMTDKLALIEQITDEGTVLLKNESNVLPLKTENKVTILGKASTALVYGGSSGNAAIGNMGSELINLTLKKGLESAGFTVNPAMWDFYKSKNLSFTAGPEQEIAPSSLPADGLNEYGEAAIVVFSRVSGEGHDAEDGYYELNDIELALVDKAKEISDKVIVIVNSPSPLAINALKNDEGVDAILQIGGAGALGAKSIGKILRGTVSPSGRLVDTYAADSRSSAAYQSAGTVEYANADAVKAAASSSLGIGSGGTKYTVFAEGIYVGYKYYETRYEDCVLNVGGANSNVGAFKSANGWSYADEVDYAFGYGLSYTSFTQEIVSFDVADNVATMSVKVTNTGDDDGKDVVQMYVQSPYTDYDKANGVEKAAIQLAGIGKTDTLKANGGTETVTVKVDLYSVASYDYKNAKTWILDDGDYYFAIGNGAHESLNNVLAKKGVTNLDGEGNADLARVWTNSEMRNFAEYEFTDKGFTTENGLFHNNVDVATTNRLDKADLNTMIDNATTYLSRSDWKNTWTSGIPQVTATSSMINDIVFEPTYEKGDAVGDSYVYGADTDFSIIMAKGLEYDDEVWEGILNQLMIEEMIATVGKNFGAIDPILGLGFLGTNDNDGVGSGPCMGYPSSYDTGSTVIDGVSKYSAIDPKMYPSETVDAATFNQKLIYELGEMLSEDCYYVNLTTLWGPGLNIHRHPYSGRNFEYFSEDSTLTYILGAQVTAGLQSNGVIAGPKHFAFNDQETDRYGYAVYVNEQAAREISLRGFEGSVAVAKAKNVMTALNRIGGEWIGTSDALQNKIMRDEWGFDGYTITDNALEPYLCGRSITRGTDKLMLLPGNDRSGELNKAALLADSNLYSSVREACHRILYVYANSKAMNGISSSSYFVRVTPWWKTLIINIDVIIGCLAALGIVGFIAGSGKARKEALQS